MAEENKSMLILVMLATTALVLGIWFGVDFQAQKAADFKAEKIQGILLTTPKDLPDFRLIDNKKREFGRENLKNTWSLLFFGYTHCPDVCPTTLQALRYVNDDLKKMQVNPPQTILVSVDPARDRPEVLDEYVGYFNQNFTGLSTTQPDDLRELNKLTAALGIYFKKAAGASGDVDADDYVMDHSAGILVINPDARVAAMLSPPHEAKRIIRDLQVIVQHYNKNKSEL